MDKIEIDAKVKIWFPLISICFLPLNFTAILAEINGFGMFNVYFPIDEALGYQDVRDDLSEVHLAGCRLVTHYFRKEHSRSDEDKPFWFGLED